MSQEADAGTATTASATSAQAQTPEPSSAANPPQDAGGQDRGSGHAPGKPLTAPLIKDPTDFLNRARQRLGISPKASETSKQTETAQPAASGSEKPAAQQGATAEDPKADEPKTQPEPVDDLAARIAKFNRTEREFAQRQEAFKAEQARAKAEREEAARTHAEKLRQADVVQTATRAIESGDIAGAFRALKADVNPSALALQLLEQLQLQDERPMSQAEVQRIVEDRIKAENEARAKEEEGKRKSEEEKQRDAAVRTLEGARENYMQACTSLFSPEKHPFIAQHGLPREAVVSYAESQKDELGRVVPPDPEELLNHFEALYRTRAERAGWAPKTVEAPKPSPSPSLNPSSLVQDHGSRLAANEPVKKLNQKREEIRRRLRVGGDQT